MAGTAFAMYYSSGARKFIYHPKHSASGLIYLDELDPEYISSARVLHLMGSTIAINQY